MIMKAFFIGLGIFYGVAFIISMCIFLYEVKHALIVPQEIDIYDL